MRFRHVWPGAIVTGLLWRGALSAFSWYARDLAAWNMVHGSIAAVVVFLLWIYVSAVILLYGVEMTAGYARLQDAASDIPNSPPQRAVPTDGNAAMAQLTRRRLIVATLATVCGDVRTAECMSDALTTSRTTIRQKHQCRWHVPIPAPRPVSSEHESPRRRAESVPAAARAQSRRLVSVGRRGVRSGARRRTSRSSCRSATRRATGAT